MEARGALVGLLLVAIVARIPSTLSQPGAPDFTFDLQYYGSTTPYRCPDGWVGWEAKCYKVFGISVSGSTAQSICEGYGADLISIGGRSANVAAVQVVLGQLNTVLQQAVDAFWIGYQCAPNDDQCHWASGGPANPLSGFWDAGQPDRLHGDCVKVDLGVNSSTSKFRWSFTECDSSKYFVCQATACLEDEYRCQDNRLCIPEDWICDGYQDCHDLSDERQCGVPCGGIESGAQGAFTSPGYPALYPRYAECSWAIDAPVGTRIKLQFSDFHTEPDFDYVKVYDGWDPRASKLIMYESGEHKSVKVPGSRSNRLLVTFQSDHADQRGGFRAQWVAEGDKCGGKLQAKSTAQWFTSPLYPDSYPDFTECVWTIKAKGGHPKIVTLQITDLDLKEPFDWVQLRNGRKATSALLATFTGSGTPRLVMTSQDDLYFKFSSHLKLTEQRGFNATYFAGCQAMLRSDHGRVESPAYGVTDYPDRLDCSWTITSVDQKPLTLTFDYFYTERDYDVVTIYDGSSDKGQDKGAFSGRASPGPFRSENGQFYISFFSDKRRAKRGWTAYFSIDCETVRPLPPHAIVNTDVTWYGTLVTYTCDAGYEVKGQNPRRCGAHGQWDSPAPACVPVRCLPPVPPKHGLVADLTGLRFGSVVTYACKEGYRLTGDTTAVCQPGGWSATPRCEAIMCDEPDALDNGYVVVPGLSYGSVLYYECEDGFDLQGDGTQYCTQHGNWSAKEPTCKRSRCPDPSPVNHGAVDGVPPYYFGDNLTLSCSNGYRPTRPWYQCFANSSWAGQVQCIDLDECGEKAASSCVNHTCINYHGGYRCQCRPGYQHQDAEQHVCVDIDECARDNGGCDEGCSNTDGGYVCTCRDGYTLYEHWASSLITNLRVNHSCVAAKCPYFGVPAHSKVYHSEAPDDEDGRYTYPASIEVVCDLGYMLNGTDPEVWCLDDGDWSSSIPWCPLALCRVLPEFPRGDLAVSDGQFMYSVARYVCDPGYELKGPSKRECLPFRVDGHYRYDWSGIDPVCEGAECGSLKAPHHGYLVGNDTRFGSEVTYACDAGFYLEGDEQRACSVDGTWSGSQPVCKPLPGCPHPGFPQFGRIVDDPRVFPVGSQVEFACNKPGYDLTEPWPLECVVDGPTTTQVFITSTTTPVIAVTTTTEATTTAPFTTTITTTTITTTATTSPTTATTAVSGCSQGFTAHYAPQSQVASIPGECAAEYGDAVLQQFSGALARLMLPCQGLDVDIHIALQAHVTILNLDVNIAVAMQLKGGLVDVNQCADSVRNSLTAPGALDGFPVLQSIEQDALDVCTVPIRMQPAQLRDNGRNCTDGATVSPTLDPATHTTPAEQQCYQCTDAASNHDCNSKGTSRCEDNEQSCQTLIRKDNGDLRISKTCKQTTACDNNALGNPSNCLGTNPNPFCFYCCQGSQCDAELPQNPLVVPVCEQGFSADYVPQSAGTNMGAVCASEYGDAMLAKIEAVFRDAILLCSELTVNMQLSMKVQVRILGNNVNILLTLEISGTTADTNICAERVTDSVLKPELLSDHAELKAITQVDLQSCQVPLRMEPEVWLDGGRNCSSQTTLSRRKRAVGVDGSRTQQFQTRVPELFVPYWNGSTPNCVDAQPPEFTVCPTELEVPLGPDGPVPYNFSQPQATDNSGWRPTVTAIPSDLRNPYTFTQNTTVVVTATDKADNEANCTFNVSLIDVTPPVVMCPSQKVVEYFNTSSIEVTGSWPQVTATDYMGVTRIDYQPPNGTLVFMRKPVLVTVTAWDEAGNQDTCQFSYLAQPLGCPDWSLEFPNGGNRSCSGNVQGQNASGFACDLACPSDKLFISDPAMYICIFYGAWLPNNYVPDCSDKLFPDYYMVITTTFSGGVIDENCTDMYRAALQRQMHQILDSPCDPYSGNFNVTVEVTKLVITTNSVEVEFYVLFTVVNVTNIGPGHVQYCANQVTSQLQAARAGDLVVRLNQSDCSDNSNSLNVTVPDKEYICPLGHILNNGFCLACPPGMYNNYSANACVACARGSYEEDYGSMQCSQCPDGHSTKEQNAKQQSQCIPVCPPGQFSEDSLMPCNVCPRGSYQPGNGSLDCTACPGDTDTARPAAVALAQCRGLCQPGTHSPDGLEPCSPCPVDQYQEDIRALSCHQCPQDTITILQGANNRSLCVVVDWCAANPCYNNATCENLGGRLLQCHCQPGFVGTWCDKEVNECESQPCRNNGTCEDLVDSYSCTCAQGFTGKDCEEGIDHCEADPCYMGTCINRHDGFDCDCFEGWQGFGCMNITDHCQPTNPCEHGGVCINVDVTYRCNCTGTGFEGANCSSNHDDCASQPCFNGAVCTDGVNSFNCTCLQGYLGDFCEEEIDDCAPDPCQNGARCHNLHAGYNCTCPAGYEGLHCGSDIDECLSSPCQNNATCTDKLNGYTCNCSTGFEGVRCQFITDNCDADSCLNLGTCVNGLNTHTCLCLEGYTGTYCETDIDDCSLSPCENKAQCTDRVNDYECACAAGYTGRNCSIEIDECEKKPCLNGGTCHDQVADYLCVCPAGWTSQKCEVNIDDCEPEPCWNNATCSDLVNGYICNCTEGWEGANCTDRLDQCISQPCLHNGTCNSGVNTFTCHCTPGYNGSTCEEDIDECRPLPCQNGGTCADLVNGYRCECREQYLGDDCELKVDNCDFNNTCQNGATCVDAWKAVSCVCTPGFVGANCEKEKSQDFDFYFVGQNGSRAEPPVTTISALVEFSVCLWVRYAGQDDRREGTFFTLAELGIEYDPVIVFDENGTRVSLFDVATFGVITVNWTPTSGAWHQACFSWRSQGGAWAVSADGQEVQAGSGYGAGRVLNADVQLLLGQDINNIGGKRQFHGELSRVNIYDYAVSGAALVDMAYNCSAFSEPGAVFAWVQFDGYLHGDAIRKEPSICGSSDCPPGYKGTLCDIAVDKSPPEVVFCPNDTTVVDHTNRLVSVNWTEPIFTDNTGVTLITQSHRVGQVLAYGEYEVVYVAYDAFNNSVVCTFKLYVLPFNCEQPPAPQQGLVAFGWWVFGQYARIACKDTVNYAFVDLPPPFYKCESLGSWDPPRGVPFRFPACSAIYPPIPNVDGTVSGTTTLPCSQDTLDSLKKSFINVMKQIDAAFGLCTGPCDYSGVAVKCDEATARRRKRQADQNTAVGIDFKVPVQNTNVTSGDGDFLSPAEAVEKTLKQDPNMADFTMTDFNVADGKGCPPSQVLNFDKTVCVSCPVGTFYDNITETCSDCPVGQFSSQEGAFSCTPCSSGQTTRGTGSANATECYPKCGAGVYYDVQRQECMECAVGYYQDQAGQDRCKACGNGQTTQRTGAKSADDCQARCALGAELGVDGTCQPCVVGTYRGEDSGNSCVVCRYGFTTSGTGATSSDACSVIQCPAGSFWDSQAKLCDLCPIGAYQSQKGAHLCEICPKGTSTRNVGGVSHQQCEAGDVNRCETGAHDCNRLNGTCVPTTDWYECRCKTGWLGDGYECAARCEDFCANAGLCSLEMDGSPQCTCRAGYMGDRCQEKDDGNYRDALIGGIVAGVLAFIILLVVILTVLLCRNQSSGKSVAQDEEVDMLHRSAHKMDTHKLIGYSNSSYHDPTRPIPESAAVPAPSASVDSSINQVQMGYFR